ncbi:MAG: roadblock/LC7 domain-containing protein [Actinomycetota bacterium]|nr:roadblock/LC7 domain-containing protein [Actinomycetota bacterium]
MAADQALAELLEVSDEVTGAVVFDRDGTVRAATVDDDQAADAAAIGAAMLAHADRFRAEPAVQRVEAVTEEGSVFVVRERNRAIVAITERDPLRGLVYHDLRTCLRKSAQRQRAKAIA